MMFTKITPPDHAPNSKGFEISCCIPGILSA